MRPEPSVWAKRVGTALGIAFCVLVLALFFAVVVWAWRVALG